MKKIFLFLILLITSVSYSQDEYIEIWTDNEGNTFYIKIVDHDFSNSSFSIWLKIVCPKGLKREDGSMIIEPNGHLLEYQTYYCKKRTYDTVEQHIYNSKGISQNSDYDTVYNRKIIPDSTPDLIYNGVCPSFQIINK